MKTFGQEQYYGMPIMVWQYETIKLIDSTFQLKFMQRKISETRVVYV